MITFGKRNGEHSINSCVYYTSIFALAIELNISAKSTFVLLVLLNRAFKPALERFYSDMRHKFLTCNSVHC